jgi:hypothetical protein
MSSVYQSFTHGPISLSQCGKRLLQALRVAIMDAVKQGSYRAGADAVAHARGELAKYMSDLEAKVSAPPVLISQEPLAPHWLEHRYGGTWKGQMAQLQNLPREYFKIVDDSLAKELDMSKKAVAARKKAAAKFENIGVRFLNGNNIAKVYNYKIRHAAKVHLGQELIVTNGDGTSVAVVVSIGAPLENRYTIDTLKEITQKVAAL